MTTRTQKGQTMRHTPGPWRVTIGDGNRDETVRVLGTQPSGNGKFHVAITNTIADAHLIAAAPELLNALRLCLIEHERISEQFKRTSDTPGMTLARAALAHAEGRET